MNIKILFVTVLLLTATGFCNAEISPEKRAEIDKMLKLTGMEALTNQMMKQMVNSFRAQMKEVPTEFWDSFEKKINTSELIEKIVPLYDKYYSTEDLQAVNAFYSSPAGQRMLSTLPKLMQESMGIGQEWGRKIGEQAVTEARAEIAKKQQAATQPN